VKRPNAHGRTSGRNRSPHNAGRTLAVALMTMGICTAGASSASAARTGASVVPDALAAQSQGIGVLSGTASVAPSTPDPYRSGVVLVGFRSGVSAGARYAIERGAGGQSATRIGPSIKPARRDGIAADEQQYLSPLKLRVAPTQVLAVARRLRRNRAVAYAEPDYLMTASAMPNDPSFSLQWAAHNTGQLIPTQESEEVLGAEAKGTAGADDRALEAWGVTTGSRSIVIGEADTGLDYNHPDLAANIWSNPGGVGACAAGTHGYNVLKHTCEPMDDDKAYGGHGTHVAGIMGAVGNNNVGVAGMNWQTTILPVKWLSASAWGETSGLIEALQWLVAAKQAGVNVRVVNDSATFPGTASSQALANEIDTLGANNILFVTAAGNTGDNNDEERVRRYPCGYDRPSEICVTATDNNDRLPSWANYGPHTVDLAAPGVSIYSTLRNGAYGYLSGGSMASPQVAGAASLILSAAPSLSVTELKARILGSVDPLPSLSGKVITGGRLDACKAIAGCATQQPASTATFGKTTVGASTDSGIFSGYKVVHAATLPTAGTVTKLSVYAVPGINSPSPQALRAVIYRDSGGSPGALVASGPEVTYRGTTNGSGWFDLPLTGPIALAPGGYWLGFTTGTTTEGMGYRFDSVANSRAYNTNAFAGGPTDPFGSAEKDSEQASIYATYTSSAPAQPSRPANTTPPTIAGTAQVGQTLTAGSGSWSESPSGYAYQWQRCDSAGANCAALSGATAQTYTLGASDLNTTVRVSVTASNAAGPSAAASSSQTALVQPIPQGVATFGKTNVGSSSDTYAADRKRVNRYALTTAGSVSKLSIYLTSAASSGQQLLQGVVYADSAGKPAALLGSSEALTFKAKSAAGWYDLKFSAPLKLAAGEYWIGVITGASGGVAGFRYDSVAGSRDYNANSFSAGPSTAFGSVSTDAEQTSLFATYTPG
jgi:thermitase